MIDIHTHKVHSEHLYKRIVALEASSLPDLQSCTSFQHETVFLSAGIHPWKALLWNLNLASALKTLFFDSRILLIGEIGLDKVSSVPFDVQRQVFDAQLEMAEGAKKPVLLHVVRAMAEVLEAKVKYPVIPSWIIHGFRGGKQESEQYTRKGFYLSFGLKFNREGLLACPRNRLFLETDDSDQDIKSLYEQVAQVLQCSVEELEKQIDANFISVFRN